MSVHNMDLKYVYTSGMAKEPYYTAKEPYYTAKEPYYA